MLHISDTIHLDCHLWYTSVNDNISKYFFIFSKFWFFGLLGGSKGKKWSKMTKTLSFALYIPRTIHYMTLICGVHM